MNINAQKFLLFTFMMSFLMSGALSLIWNVLEVDLHTYGTAENVEQWVEDWAISLFIAYPLSMIFVPIIRHFISELYD